MLCYWILRRNDGAPTGLVRVQNDRVLLKPTGQITGTFTLFSDTEAVPIVPDSETYLCGVKAVLGTEGERVTCFAAAPDAAPQACYRKRLYQNRTIKEKPVSPEPEPSNKSDISQNNTIEMEEKTESTDNISLNNTIEAENPDSISDTARETEAFSLLLNRAEAFFSAYEGTDSTDEMVQKEDIEADRESGIDLFRQEFPGARWRYVDGTDVLPHYEGVWRQPNGQTLHILAVRGRAAPRPPRALLGFTRYLRDGDGTGYWLRLTPLPQYS